MRVTEDDEVHFGEPVAKSRQPTLLRPCVVDHAYPQAGQVKFGGFGGSPSIDVWTVVVAEDGMHWRKGRQLLEYARHADVAGVQNHLSRGEVMGHPGRTALPESRGVCVGEDHDAHRLIVPARLKLHRIDHHPRSMAHRLREYQKAATQHLHFRGAAIILVPDRSLGGCPQIDRSTTIRWPLGWRSGVVLQIANVRTRSA